MFNTTHRLSWLSSLTTAAFLGFMTLLSGCGGGGASSSNTLPMTVVPGEAITYAYADTPTVLTIRAGKKPFNVYSSNTAIISFNSATMPGGQVPDEAIVLEGPTGNYGRVNNVDSDTVVTLTIRDAEGVQVNVAVTVKPSSLNSSLTITGDASGTICPGGADVLCSGSQGTASVKATTITGGPVIGHKVRFRVMDQGAKYGFVCNQSLGDCLVIESDSLGHAITIETTTDRNGDAFAVIRADVNAPTQFATISATDQATGHVLRRQFMIAGLALAAMPTTGTWTIALSGVAPVAPETRTDYTNACPGASAVPIYTMYTIFGGTPPYKVTSSNPLIGTVLLALPATGTPASSTSAVTVANTGDSFVVLWPSDACTGGGLGIKPSVTSGTATILIMDATGAVLSPSPTFVVTATVN